MNKIYLVVAVLLSTQPLLADGHLSENDKASVSSTKTYDKSKSSEDTPDSKKSSQEAPDSNKSSDDVPDSIHGHALEGAMHLNEVVITGITGNTLLKNSPTAVMVVGNEELQARPSTNIIDAIAHQPGVSQITTGGGISKPVIRGMGYNRALVISDGVRQEGQQWGDEHGVEIDGNDAYSAEILKGPATLMYGSDALAGVILLNSAPIMPKGTMKLGGMAEYQSNNSLLGYSLNFKGHQGDIVWNWRYSGKFAQQYKNKYDGRVPGTAYREQAVKGMTGINQRWGFTHLILSYFHLNPSIAEGERDEETGELEGDKEASYKITLPFQRVNHYKAALDNSFHIGDGNLKVLLAYQQNQRKEYEESDDEYSLYFKLHTLTYDLRYISPEMRGWKISAGLNGMWQKSENLGEEFLVPAYKLFDTGIFATASKTFGRLNATGGIRFDTRHLHSFQLIEDDAIRFNDFKRNFTGFTGSIGATYELAHELNLKANVSRGYRAPNISELGSNGNHEGTLRYEKGNQDLKAEQSWQFDLGIDYSSAIFSVELALFANAVSNYIYLAKQTDAAGNAVLTDGLSTYSFRAGDATLLGGELMTDLHPIERLHIENDFSIVDARLRHQPDESKYLPFTPPAKWSATVRYDILKHTKGCIDNLFAAVGMEHNFKQNHYYAAGGTETATPAYTLWNIQAGADIKVKGKKLCSICLTCENLTDKAYQSHLSRLKYADRNNATGRTGVFNMGRNFGVKLVF